MEVLSIEEEGDNLYMSAIKGLFQTVNDPKELFLHLKLAVMLSKL